MIPQLTAYTVCPPAVERTALSPRSLRFVLPLLIAFISLVVSGASAQVVFNGVQTSIAGGFNQPTGVAVDPAGNVYGIVFGGNQQLKFSLQPDGTYVQSSLGSGFAFPSGVAIDANGNLFIPDFYHNTVVELSPSGGGYTQTTLTLDAGGGPSGIAVDSSGNLYVTNPSANAVYLETPAGGSTYTKSTVVSGLASGGPFGVAVDASGNVFIADTGNNQVLMETPAGGGSFTQTTLASGLSGPNGVAVDAAGNVYISDSGNNRILKETVAGANYTQSVVSSSFSNPYGLTADSNGNLYVANDGGPLNFLKLNLTSVPFGSQAVGVASSTIALPFTVTSGTTIGSISVLTTGLAGKDFTDAGSSTCTATAYGSDTPCVVNVQFTPLAPGLRHGAVVIRDGSNHVLAIVPLSGFGTGSQAVYGPSSAKSLGSGLGTVFAMATDAAGNVYIADSGNAHVVKITPSGTQTNLGSGHHQPHSVAVDGAGNVFVGEVGTGSVAKITPAGVQTTVVSGLNEPYGLLFDAAGNMIICDPNLNKIFKISPLGVQTTVASNFNFAAGITEDSMGNLYITDAGLGIIYKLTPAGVQSTVATGLNVPAGVTIDAAGNFYVALFGNGQIIQLAPGGAQTVLASGGSNPFGITLDDGGNLFFTDSGSSKAFQIVRATPPALAYANTAYSATSSDSPQTVQVQNVGSTSLNFVSVTYPADFPEDASGVSDCSTMTPLAVNGTCTLTIDFTPISTVGVGPNALLSENVAVTTDNLAAPLQNVAVSGTEIGTGVSSAPIFSTGSGTYSNAQSITITDADPGTVFYYTINGTTPTAASRLYTGPVTIANSFTLKAIAGAPGKSFSSVTSATYTLAAATPVISLPGGVYATPQIVSLSTDSTAAHIYYTFTPNGLPPTGRSTLYTGPITISSNGVLKAITSATGYSLSGVASATYIIQAPPTAPTFSAAPGTYNNALSLAINESVPGATIYYTLNGTTPTTASNKYNGPIAIGNTFTVKAIAVAPGYSPTTATSGLYKLQVATPVVNLGTGTYTGTQNITITSASTAARFFYTTNGTTPSVNSTKYTGPIAVSASETLKIVASATGYTSSPVVTNSYIIQ